MDLETIKTQIWDVIVVGGGPAGMMAAGRATELGKGSGIKVLLIEKNDTLGKKLLITGGGRCNVTNAELDTRKLLTKYKENDKFLFSAFSQWSVKETLDFFHLKSMQTKEEAEKRIFPMSEKAQSVWDVMVDYIKLGDVTVLSNTPVLGFIKSENKLTGVKIKGAILTAKSYILATGGKSRPETGSTGDGYVWLKDIGHTVVEPEPSLVPIAVKNKWVSHLTGISLQNIKLTTFQNGQKQESKKGKILFTHVGVSGPTILNMSKDIGELLKYGDVLLEIDALPDLDYGQLNIKLQDIFKINNTKKIKNSLNELLTGALVPVILQIAGIDSEKICNAISREDRLILVKIIKHIPLNVKGLLGVDKAIITSGGVSLEEVDFKTMQSRLFPNLYIVGDMLNIDRPSGGYSLQLCWTTGFVAGSSVTLKS